ncbi:MAG: hypothetical protein RI952_439 [Bacteroidota bacterium]
MRKAIIIFLLTSISYFSFGELIISYLRYQNVKAKVSFAINHHIAVKGIQKIRIANKNAHLIKWKEKHEFIFQQKLYDVFYSEKLANEVHYYCIEDKAEGKALAAIEQSLTQNEPANSNPIQKVSKLLNTKYLITKKQTIVFCLNSIHQIHNLPSPKVRKHIISIELPPPQLN